ncbi:MAG TPA: RagB/SusD family nutrient uptake outer membrane protein [Flavitalea sp.]|nr:RagB/SusD family nutrient uptake outer membrane protein [Flavitalea sp.]
MQVKIKYIYFFVLLPCLLMFAGCKKSFLDADIHGAIPIDSYYKTDEEAIAATTSVYNQLKLTYQWGGPYLMKQMLSDEANKGGGGAGDWPEFKLVQTFTFDPQNSVINDSWNSFYGIISRANLVINNVQPESEIRTRLIAEAKILRAHSYFELVTLWGAVPIVLDNLPVSSWSDQKRDEVVNVYAQIEKDLSEGFEALLEKSIYDISDRWRASKGTARGLLLKTYLFEKKWDQAISLFTDIESSNEFSLEPDFDKIFTWQSEFGPESLFEVQFTIQGPVTDWLNNNMNIQLMAPNQDYYTQASGDGLKPGWGFNIATPKIWNAFVAAGDSGVRRQSTLWSEAELEAKDGKMDPACYDWEGFLRRKYGSFESETTSDNGADFTINYSTNQRLLRYSDVLLMAAEAYYMKGDEGNALKYLNMVRIRAALPDITSSGGTVLDAIVKERQLELAFEGNRFQDLVRWGLAKQELEARGFVIGKHELLPIPFSEMQIDPSLTQNPGY